MSISSYHPTITHQILLKNSANCCMTRGSKISTASTGTVNTSTTLSAALEVTVEYT